MRTYVNPANYEDLSLLAIPDLMKKINLQEDSFLDLMDENIASTSILKYLFVYIHTIYTILNIGSYIFCLLEFGKKCVTILENQPKYCHFYFHILVSYLILMDLDNHLEPCFQR